MTSLPDLIDAWHDFTDQHPSVAAQRKWLSENVPTDRKRAFARKLADSMTIYERARRSCYYYMLTLSVDPKKHPEDTPQFLALVEDRISNMHTRMSARGIVGLVYVREYTQAGRAHWHVAVRSEAPMESRHFSWYRKHVGNYTFSRNRTQNPQTMIDYLSKDEEIVTILPL
jgi:hypothetical protein